MKCLLDNTKTRAESDLVHNTCSASAIADVNDCFLTNKKARNATAMPAGTVGCLSRVREEECVANAQVPAVTGPAPQNSTVTETAEDKCSTSISFHTLV